MSPKYLIGDVSNILHLSKDTLRYYDKLGLVTPRKDVNNNYRYYTTDDLVALTYVMLLKDLDISLADIKKMMHESTLSDFHTLLKKQEETLERKRLKLQKTQDIVTSFREDIEMISSHLEKITLDFSPPFIYKTIHSELDQTYTNTLEEMSDHPTINVPMFTVIFPAKDFFQNHDLLAYTTSICGILKVNIQGQDYKDYQLIPSSLCIHTVIKTVNDCITTDLTYIQNYLNTHKLTPTNHIVARNIAFERPAQVQIEYYDLWIPIIQH